MTMIRSLNSVVVVVVVAVVAVASLLALADAVIIEPNLYSPEDNIQILNNETLEPHLHNSTKSNFVEFINYFCGDCRRFAPTFKNISAKLYDWQRLLSVSAVDCAQERNVQICRDYKIIQTPTLRVFPPHFQRTPDNIGHEIKTHEPSGIYEQLAEFISRAEYTTEGYPNFEPIDKADSLEKLLKQQAVNYLVLVLQPINSTIGRDLLLELLTWPIVAVRIVENRELLTNFGLNPKLHKLGIIDAAGKVEPLQPAAENASSYAASVANYLQTGDHTPVPPLATTPAPNASKYFVDEEQQAIISNVLQLQPKVYRADLEQAIDKLIHIELPKVDTFTGDNMLALQQLIHVLHLHNPLNVGGKQLLSRLDDFVYSMDAKGELGGVAFQMQVQNHERKLPKAFKSKRYVGCLASSPFLRGFTCSLWTLFHYLTVESAKTQQLPPGTVLKTIHGFVKHFFGCRDCVEHFLDMAERRKLFAVDSYDEEILWLWEAHNEVNARIAGDSTEDVQFPKIQYPSAKDCKECRGKSEKDIDWHRQDVLRFLKQIYDRKNLSSYGLPTPIGYD